ncbi:MAG: 2,3-bisphosphoglycerate-independent phosphoglycerate mutase, partial [Candidatus Marinimicrobia bacterium]|nr:2,3-bisphosphoglycerate-independent phosphoglycerate mutase [Candidatus Neomarinimicrobiota bacterium]
KKNKKPIHLMGLLSDAGVHADYNHLKKILLLLKKNNIQNIYLHAITDGRDTSPNSGRKYLENILEFMKQNEVGKLSTIIGRFYAMDRDNRWERVEVAYRLLTDGKGVETKEPLKIIDEMYEKNITDEFMEPIKVVDENNGGLICDGDAVLSFNFRADRVREISTALNFDDFDKFDREKLNLEYVTMTKYQDNFPFPVLFEKEKLENVFGKIISKKGLTQLRIAETEKYAHVTYFFNGGEEKEIKNESRILVPSPKVKTYDLQPEMNAPIVTEKLLNAINSEKHDVIILNFANGDMVGHTGILDSAIEALEKLDNLIGQIVTLFTEKNGTVLITADHGNCEKMYDEKNDKPHTQHTLNPVPFIMINSKSENIKLKSNGKLADIAPTMLQILDIPQPSEMTGESLIE